jgi:choice-of-anchor B domain-containing protein
MVNKSGNIVKKLVSLIVVLIALLALALPAQASEYIPPPANLAQTPTVEINPDANHHDHASADFLRVPLSLAELAVSSCSGGFAAEYPCQGIDFMSRVPLTSFTGNPTSASNLWGYVDLDDNREYAIIGLRNGTGIVEVTDPANPRVVKTIVGVSSQWRELKVYQFWNATASRWDAYAYVTTEGAGGGIQIIDLTQLPADVSLAGTWTGVSTSHTDQISNIDFSTNASNNPEFPPILYISGANTGGLRFVSLANPTSLTEVGFWTGTYSHDTYPQVFTDARANQRAPGHNPCEVVFSFAGTAGLKIIDVTNKSAPVTLSTLTYSQLGYVHSGWISSDGNYIFLHDELDEQNFAHNSWIRTINITSLTAPTVSTIYTGPSAAIDHNGYTIGNKFYFSNYTRGIGVLDVTNPNAPVELSYFDTYPTSNSATFNGAWGVYPFLPSGNILISDIQRGLIVVREQSAAPTLTPAVSNTPTNTPTASNTPTPSNTPTQTRTPTSTPTATQTSSAGNTGFLSPSTNAAQTSSAGDNNGFEVIAANAHTAGGGVAQDVNSGTKNDSACTSNSKDKHRFYDFNISLLGGATVKGIEVRLDAFADSTSSSPRMCVQLSWDGGTTWTTTRQTPTLTTSQATYILGSPTDTWGRTWTLANLSNASFRVRVIDLASSSGATSRDFSLDWIAVRVSY